MDDDEQWRAFVAEHLKAIRGSLATITFVVVVAFLFRVLGVIAAIANSGSF